MNRTLAICAFLAAAAITTVSVQCDLVSGGAPTNLRIAAPTDSTVRLSWAAPAEGRPTVYMISFKQARAQGFAPLTETNDTVYVHNPHGVTGAYKVVARFGSEVFEAGDKPSTVPAFTDTLLLGELNSSTRSGYGWSRDSGIGERYAMDEQLNADEVDFYITDFDSGFAGPKYSIASPNLGPTDPGGSVPTAAWRVSGFTPSVVYEDVPLPAYDQFAYSDSTLIDTVPMAVGCYTEDGYYAMVKFTEASTGLGQVRVKSWFQLVKGLRLIMH